ncbi:NAD(P)-dependent dehydrogenase (short-subunit alcohol dehydrogenase family) [Roseiarcus fermentans]|uniref:NAD(P)-dependent dehydrogenase (Short-subunit alcohol dehydrogenase family) n=1 Tax=Roseiarcus fermentans TaxID=1473586 RepID=A0A366EK77_9HYPH|nr:SDR family oxidoreductase [Roseiarcus fermentans]RBP02120.1 NAD(P)-dependent dehydrogenase (short-subunit alcohol dehydrogenase family) [Roseiarcus fermentans]
MAEHVFIVGGTSGIGLAAAARLKAAGYAVTIAGRDPGKLDSARRLLGEAGGLAMDACDDRAVTAAFASVGPIDHLVLAFGSHQGAGPLAAVTMDSVRAGFAEKTLPHIACLKAALPTLRPDGSVTILSAVSAYAGMPGTAGLAAANAAVAALVPALAAELRPLRINGVAPGVVDTPWWNFMPAEQKQAAFASYAAMTPVGRNGAPEDIADAIGFLIGNGFMNGETIVCDGGVRWGGRPA